MPLTMALTATTTQKLREELEELLGMVNPIRIIQSPDKANISYAVFDAKKKQEKLIDYVLSELRQKRVSLPRMIIFCQLKSDCGKLYTYFQWGQYGADLHRTSRGISIYQ